MECKPILLMQHFSIFLLVLATCIYTVQLQSSSTTLTSTTITAKTNLASITAKTNLASSTAKTVPAIGNGKVTPSTTVPPGGNQSSNKNTSTNILPSVYIIGFAIAVISFIPKFGFK